MALMDKPTGPAPEDQTELSDVVSLEEDGDVEEENIQFSELDSFIESQFRLFWCCILHRKPVQTLKRPKISG